MTLTTNEQNSPGEGDPETPTATKAPASFLSVQQRAKQVTTALPLQTKCILPGGEMCHCHPLLFDPFPSPKGNLLLAASTIDD